MLAISCNSSLLGHFGQQRFSLGRGAGFRLRVGFVGFFFFDMSGVEDVRFSHMNRLVVRELRRMRFALRPNKLRHHQVNLLQVLVGDLFHVPHKEFDLGRLGVL